jgi:hypothetical protein
VRRAVSALQELKKWLEAPAPEDFVERFVDEHDYNPEMDNRQFWDGILQG